MSHFPLRVGLIGAGGITHAHLPAWQELGATVTVFALAGAETLAEHYPIRIVGSAQELFEHSDIVDICTPTPTHREYAEAALLAGKDVICEKPIALTRADADAIGDLARRLGRRVYPAQVVRFFPEYALAKQAVDSGSIGRMAVSRFTRIGEYPHWAPWFSDEALSGGIVMDQMIHDIDIARWISGEVSRVYAVRSASRAGDRVSAQVTLTHKNGALSYVTGVWGAPGTTFTTGFSLAGTLGVLTHDTSADSSVALNAGTTAPQSGMRPDTSLVESPYLTELREFAAACTGGPEPRVLLEDGARAVELAEAANLSIRLKRPVSVAPGKPASIVPGNSGKEEE
ncbi:Gfo/Idh/MocA family oxidoreductase [Lysinibacter sp. HNR]|uniref:Gfo/Idh/MocA family protein n=1 Tax=Lysinibacter sp. HNR TaxID=3031408 RepID=UPI002435F4BE|nr:Gfo/Idh/MocA family oxidoreductase [Lysinibacter sp. HNR]WGD37816.1 Gfo/Idh/MocA family oxidoreductase [Lysinibacter sp. HNR]